MTRNVIHDILLDYPRLYFLPNLSLTGRARIRRLLPAYVAGVLAMMRPVEILIYDFTKVQVSFVMERRYLDMSQIRAQRILNR